MKVTDKASIEEMGRDFRTHLDREGASDAVIRYEGPRSGKATYVNLGSSALLSPVGPAVGQRALYSDRLSASNLFELGENI